ncbi:intraflagellar transport protein 56-like protein [Leptotrombidium deliense]|uniref:Intraflagellar transport protein 56-like protein n=1 Tax=Leptotrombidium deliense TaxID=299467 RepID=A0A443RXL9_9ACAR|nr:intraflagellar transport protein 56-like protein [Leptotrombidium deliense]
MGQFFYSAKAFDLLEKIDTNPEYWEGKRGACCGLFQMIVAKKEPKEMIHEIFTLLRNSSNPQTEQIIKVMKNWGKENNVIV